MPFRQVPLGLNWTVFAWCRWTGTVESPLGMFAEGPMEARSPRGDGTRGLSEEGTREPRPAGGSTMMITVYHITVGWSKWPPTPLWQRGYPGVTTRGEPGGQAELFTSGRWAKVPCTELSPQFDQAISLGPLASLIRESRKRVANRPDGTYVHGKQHKG